MPGGHDVLPRGKFRTTAGAKISKSTLRSLPGCTTSTERMVVSGNNHDREYLKNLVDQIPEEFYDRIGAFLQRLIDEEEGGKAYVLPAISLKARLVESVAQIDRGEGIPHEEIEAILDGWIAE